MNKPEVKLKPLENVVVNLKTQEQFNELMRVYELAGLKWISGNCPTFDFKRWEKWKEDTCITAGEIPPFKNGFFAYEKKKKYKEKQSEIIFSDEYYKIQGKTPEEREKIKNYFKSRKK